MNGWERLRARGSEEGSGGGLSLVMLTFFMGLILILGLVMDGGAKARAVDRANQIASEAARAALQVVTVGRGVDTSEVEKAATDYLTAHGATGTATVIGQQLDVSATVTEPTRMLWVIGIDQFTVTGQGTAYLDFDL